MAPSTNQRMSSRRSRHKLPEREDGPRTSRAFLLFRSNLLFWSRARVLLTAMPSPSSAKHLTLRLVCWNGADGERHAAELRRAGYRVVAQPLTNPGGAVGYFRELEP